MTTRESSSPGLRVRAPQRTIYYSLDHQDHYEVSQGGSPGVTVRDPGVLPFQTAWPVRPSKVAPLGLLQPSRDTPLGILVEVLNPLHTSSIIYLAAC